MATQKTPLCSRDATSCPSPRPPPPPPTPQSLRTLELNTSAVCDLTGLASLGSLTNLGLDSTGVVDLGVLAQCNSLEVGV